MRLDGAIGIGMVVLCFVAATVSVRAQESVTLAWDANSESDLAGYRIYYGLSSQGRTNRIDVGNATTVTVSNLSRGVTYLFVATAYNTSGLESEPSNEVSYTVADEPRPLLIMAETIVVGTNGNVQFNISGSSGDRIVVEGSTNLVSWFPLATNTFTNSTLGLVVNPRPPSPTYFFRVAYQ